MVTTWNSKGGEGGKAGKTSEIFSRSYHRSFDLTCLPVGSADYDSHVTSKEVVMTPEEDLRCARCSETFDVAKTEMFPDKHGKATAQEMPKLVSIEQIQQDIADMDRARA